MTFTTPCFVYVPSDNERKDLIKWLEIIGYKIADHLFGKYVVANVDEVYSPLDIYNSALINCGLDVCLFRALAAMNDENDREQWLVVEHEGSSDEMVYVNSEDTMAYVQSGSGFRKATSEEIVEYFKKR